MNHTLTIYGSRLLRRWVCDKPILTYTACSFSIMIYEFHCMIQVTHPLCDRNLISARLDAVSEIAESMGSYKTSEIVGQHDEDNSDITIVEPQFYYPQFYYILSSVLTSLGRSPDIQRGITRIFHRTATPSEVTFCFPWALKCEPMLRKYFCYFFLVIFFGYVYYIMLNQPTPSC